jgi:hypothetical protein
MDPRIERRDVAESERNGKPGGTVGGRWDAGNAQLLEAAANRHHVQKGSGNAAWRTVISATTRSVETQTAKAPQWLQNLGGEQSPWKESAWDTCKMVLHATDSQTE